MSSKKYVQKNPQIKEGNIGASEETDQIQV